jgi:hypothetical protein
MVIGHRSAIRHTHDVVLYANQYQVYDDDMSCVQQNNKQHAVGIEQISKEKKSSLCARLFNRNKHCNEWYMDEADNSKREKE